MHRPLLFLALLLPALCGHASCRVAPSASDTISLVVGEGGCLGSAAQRQVFAEELKSAVQAMEGGRRPGLQRKSTADQLNGFGDLRRQAEHLSPPAPVYYGQR
ncbi:hypothetical protein KTQ42_13780|uniref:hypothetical protein n=1 Tax=Noviherbaspirillum sp. L7-7A TaxID=2850560 RepID=UPI001C2C6B9B|nr:hypothetical protein [Noviherbaspirillum sp. L7-7A]MBV0880377.1 hypothetical protein [Noviherbaspirillum sp. L7-7A]